MPGEPARERHARVTAAIRTLGAALSGADVGLDGVPLDAALVGAPAPAAWSGRRGRRAARVLPIVAGGPGA